MAKEAEIKNIYNIFTNSKNKPGVRPMNGINILLFLNTRDRCSTFCRYSLHSVLPDRLLQSMFPAFAPSRSCFGLDASL